MINIIKPNQS